VEARLADLIACAPTGTPGIFEAALAVGQRAGVCVALDPHQRPRQRLAGGRVAHHAMDSRQRNRRGILRRGLRPGDCRWLPAPAKLHLR